MGSRETTALPMSSGVRAIDISILSTYTTRITRGAFNAKKVDHNHR